MFAMVMAIGLLVDDAIVVWNVERVMSERITAAGGDYKSMIDQSALVTWSRAHPFRTDGVLPRLDRRHLPAVR